MPPPLPIACPILIGRSASLTEIVRLAERAAGGQGQVGLVSGDAGIGKSRLLAEARVLLAGAKEESSPAFLMLEGRCFEEDRQLPYAPFLDLLRRNLAAMATEPAGSAGVSSPDVTWPRCWPRRRPSPSVRR